MAKRILDLTPAQMTSLTKAELIGSIAGSEGRVLASETIGMTMPLLVDVTNAEYAAAMGADIILLNMFDVCKPYIMSLPQVAPEDTVREIKRLTGRIVGINLEPVDPADIAGDDSIWKMSNGVSNSAITASLQAISEALGDEIVLVAGKMHASGVVSEGGENIITKEDVRQFAQAGADIILMPAPGTVPGITTEYIRGLVSYAHSLNKLTLTAIGTSQEGADVDTIRRIALECKMTGTDIHHIGDSGIVGMALPENIQAYSIAIRGVRHTHRRMAMSLAR